VIGFFEINKTNFHYDLSTLRSPNHQLIRTLARGRGKALDPTGSKKNTLWFGLIEILNSVAVIQLITP